MKSPFVYKILVKVIKDGFEIDRLHIKNSTIKSRHAITIMKQQKFVFVKKLVDHHIEEDIYREKCKYFNI